MGPFLFDSRRYPESPGCYVMKDAEGRILYIGKSIKLRSRLRSYFNLPQTRTRMRRLVEEVASIDIMLVNNETESLMLENHLIKLHKPPYNRALKRDNSGYAYIKLTSEPYPRLEAGYRNRRQAASDVLLRESEPDDVSEKASAGASAASDDGVRFGPFASARFRSEVMTFVTDHFRLRTCESMPKRVCLLYHIGKCSGICEGKISEQEYRDSIKQASALLANGGEGLLAAMYRQMGEYAEQLRFERAADMLRYIRVLEREPDRQIVDRESAHNQDVLYFGAHEVMVARVRAGMLSDFAVHPYEGELPAAADRFIAAHYRNAAPEELIVNAICDAQAVRAVLRQAGQAGIRITLPKRGLKLHLLELCRQNLAYRLSCAAGSVQRPSASRSLSK